MGDMVRYYGIAFALIVLLLMIHFKSFSQPIIILMMIPTVWIGATWGHGIECLLVSILSAWGMVVLAYGVLFGTFFKLIFFPALIMALNDIKVWFKKAWTGERPARGQVEVAVVHSMTTLD